MVNAEFGKCTEAGLLGRAIRYAVFLIPSRRSLSPTRMPESVVTDKFQVTIPKEVREDLDIKPGEKVIVEKRDADSVVIRRYRRIRQPLKHLIGKKRYHRAVRIEELEEKLESR